MRKLFRYPLMVLMEKGIIIFFFNLRFFMLNVLDSLVSWPRRLHLDSGAVVAHGCGGCCDFWMGERTKQKQISEHGSDKPLKNNFDLHAFFSLIFLYVLQSSQPQQRRSIKTQSLISHMSTRFRTPLCTSLRKKTKSANKRLKKNPKSVGSLSDFFKGHSLAAPVIFFHLIRRC